MATLLLFFAYILPAAAMLLYAEHFFSARVNADLFPLPWLADGVAVSLMLLWGTRIWPAVFLGSIFIWGVLRGDPAILVGVDAVGETLSVVIAVKILRAFHFRRQLGRLSDPLLLIAGALAGRVIAALADIIGTLTGAWLTPHSLAPEFLQMATRPGTLTPAVTPELVWAMARWQMNALTGIALAVPLLLSSPRKLRHSLRSRPLALASLGMLSLTWMIGALELSATWTCWPLLLTALMLVAWAAIDFGALAAELCTVLFACAAAAAFSQGLGPAASADAMGGLAATWGFIGLLCCVSPILTVILTARQHQDTRLTVLAERYRSLFTANPTPTWVTDASSGTILMANAEAVRRYGYAEAQFLGMRLSDLSANQRAGEEPPPPDADLVAAPLVKHRTGDGKLIDVELVTTPLELDGLPVKLVHAVDMTDHQDLRRRLLATVAGESCRVSQELHDGLGQVLAGLAIGSEALLQRSEREPSLDLARAAHLRELTNHAQLAESHLYQLTSGVSPLDELQGDLLEALRRLPTTVPAPQRARVQVIIEGDAPVTLSLERREHLYRVVQESLANALKHANAERILIRCALGAAVIRVSVEDDGIGLQQERVTAGLGLQSMKSRATAAGAELAVQGLNGGGTVVTCSCPQIEPAASAPAAGPPRADRAPAGEAQQLAAQPSRWADLRIAASIVLACWFGGAISHALASAHNLHFTFADTRLAVPSLLAGAAVSSLLLAGRRWWPAVLLGIASVRFGQIGEPVLTAMLLSAISTAGVYALVVVIQRWGFALCFDRWQDPLVLCAASGVAWAAVNVLGFAVLALPSAIGGGPAPGVAALYSSATANDGVHLTSALLAAEVRWWLDTLAGTVLLVPTLTLPATLRSVVKESPSELCVWSACVAAWAVGLLAVSTANVLLPLLTLSILLVVWAAARLGVAFASLATLLFSMAAAASYSTQTGALATQDASTGVAYVWGFVGVLTVIGLFVAALLAEHNRRHREIAAVNQRYRSLFQGDPRPLWLHDSHTGLILEANEPAARAYGYSMAEFTSLQVTQLLAPGMSPDAFSVPDDRAVGPLPMKHLTRSGDRIEVEVWSYGTLLDGRRVSICFAHDVTERNTLRRLLFDRAELERRQLATELRQTLAGPLADLRIVAQKLLLGLRRHAPPDTLRELLESLARRAKRAAECCREVAHRLSPLQANCGDLVSALHALRRQIPDGAPLEISVLGEAPLSLDQRQSEHLFSLLSEVLTRCLPGRRSVHVAIRTFEHTVRVAVDAEACSPSGDEVPGLARHPSVLLRARAMGARLWERSIGAAHTRLVCDYPL
ncbi:MAG TPA: MASE1 domain-containing protein [Steroidobacteraceae bacterium]|nr:MASE1 domain-containing protein [Steroidobacteraceae bacterium]